MKTMICKSFDVVEIPFPFIDSPKSKKRKALVISNQGSNAKNNATTMAMITSATHSKWDMDTFISNLKTAGLKKNCYIRFKIFTIDNYLIKNKSGELSQLDRTSFTENFQKYFLDIKY